MEVAMVLAVLKSRGADAAITNVKIAGFG